MNSHRMSIYNKSMYISIQSNIIININKGKQAKITTCAVPYRHSLVTMILKDCLEGNFHATKCSDIRPSSSDYEEKRRWVLFNTRRRFVAFIWCYIIVIIIYILLYWYYIILYYTILYYTNYIIVIIYIMLYFIYIHTYFIKM